MEIEVLESNLARYLGLPSPDDPLTPGQVRVRTVPLSQLRSKIVELKKVAEQIGRVPQGYPRHVELVMRGLAALLPWYTRPLVQFGKQTTDTLSAMEAAIRELAERDELRAKERTPVR